ncbi:hypothetical protein CcaverHIS631_0400140 [Cutaneotrichosporon cavernicola]|nr:hypothetical protein CcaverHIS631_0400140 [Cutaneotrichosporon cavernicola]BEJ06745.1 hypothetical protein CcaverHIS641_0400140 [Cutaneotrichosporon cavernicola]
MSVTNKFRNPILPGFNPDPSICHVPGKGYFVATSSFEYFPGLPVYHSTDLNSWTLIGHALNRRSQGVDMRTVETSAGLWAPTFRYHKGRWYMICSCFWRLRIKPGEKPDAIPSGFYVWTDDIFDDSKWSDAVYFEEIGFDQDLLFDDDGRVYQTVTRFDFDAPTTNGQPLIQSWINEIDLATGTSLTEPVLAKASPLGVAEGCHLLKKDGWYYFFTAEGGTQDGHRECVYRSRSPSGPFEAPPDGVNPVVYNADHPEIQNTGHMDLVEGPNGQWVAVFLGVRPVFPATVTAEGVMGMPSHLGREAFMAPMEWVDGWPVVNSHKPIELIGDFPGLQMGPAQTGWVDQFDQEKLSLGWYTLRVPLRQFYSLTERPGYLALRGGPTSLNIEHCPSVLLQKQPGFNLDWSTQLEFAPTQKGQEAGTVVWMNKSEHAALGLRGKGDGNVEVVFRRPDNGQIVVSIVSASIAPATPVTFHVYARKQQYEFAYTIPGADPVVVGTMASSELKPLFTGVHLGLYAQGVNDTPCLNRAYFKYARWENATD